jgi:hypothetical protein
VGGSERVPVVGTISRRLSASRAAHGTHTGPSGASRRVAISGPCGATRDHRAQRRDVAAISCCKPPAGRRPALRGMARKLHPLYQLQLLLLTTSA